MDELDKKTIDDLVKGWGHLIQQPEPESISEPKPAPKLERKVKPASLPEIIMMMTFHHLMIMFLQGLIPKDKIIVWIYSKNQKNLLKNQWLIL